MKSYSKGTYVHRRVSHSRPIFCTRRATPYEKHGSHVERGRERESHLQSVNQSVLLPGVQVRFDTQYKGRTLRALWGPAPLLA